MTRPIPVDPDKITEYKLKGDDSESPVVFLLGVLTPRIKARLNDTAMNWSVNTNGGPEEKGNVHSHLNTRNVEIVKWGLRGWKNFTDEKGKEVLFDFAAISFPGRHGTLNICSERTLDQLPVEVVDELAGVLMPTAFITPVEEKN